MPSRRADDARDFLDRLVVVVDEVDHFAMLGAQPIEAVAQPLALALLLHGDLGIVASIGDLRRGVFVERVLLVAAQGREGLVARHRQKPSRGFGASLELGRAAPDVDENLAHHILRGGFVAQQTQREAIDLHMVAAVEGLQRELIADAHAREQIVVRFRRHGRSRTLPVCRSGSVKGSNRARKRFVGGAKQGDGRPKFFVARVNPGARRRDQPL